MGKMNNNAEKWEAASNELKTEFYARMTEEKAGIRYFFLNRQKMRLYEQIREESEVLFFYFKALCVCAAVLAVLEYLILNNLRGYFTVVFLFLIFIWKIFKARSAYISSEIDRVAVEIATIRADSVISSIVIGRGFEKYFENRLIDRYEDTEQHESYMTLQRKRLENLVFVSLIETKINPFL
jgi:predicted ATPase